FSPPFCPNPKCEHASSKCSSSLRFSFKRKGVERRQDGSSRIRYLCHGCKKNFSDATFHLTYRLKKRGHLNARIFDGVVHNRSNRSLSRELGISESSVRLRVLRLSRLALLRHHEFLGAITIKEDV